MVITEAGDIGSAQAMDIIKRQGNPPAVAAILSRFANVKLDI